MGDQTRRLTPGKRLVRQLNRAVEAAGGEFSDVAVAVSLPLIEATADRVGMLRGKLDSETERDGPLAVRVVQLAGELRQLENQLARMVAALGIDDDEELSPPKARPGGPTRRDPRSHRRVPA